MVVIFIILPDNSIFKLLRCSMSMSKLEKLKSDLSGLLQVENKIITRVWETSEDAVALDNTPLNTLNIKKRVEHLADELVKDLPNGNPVLVGLMDGAVPFANLLMDALNARNYEYDCTTMSVSSYGHGLISGELKVGAMPKVELTGRNVVVVDDVCDTGKTLKRIRDEFLKKVPNSLKLMVLVDKVQDRPNGCSPDYSGFKISPDAFIIGMGLDFMQALRNKPSIKTANLKSLPSTEEQKLLNQIPVLRTQIITENEMMAISPGKFSIFNNSEEVKTGASISFSMNN